MVAIKSIRLYLLVVLLSAICLVNFIAALSGYRSSVQASNEQFNRRLDSMAQSVLNLVENGTKLETNTFAEDVIFQVWKGDELLFRSGNSPTQHLARQQAKHHLSNVNAVQWRIASLANASQTTLVIYGERNDTYNKIIDSLVVRALLPIFWVLPLLGILVWLIVGLGLKPLQRFVASLTERGPQELKPISVAGYPKELNSLVQSTNTLFVRLDRALQRETRFAADAAHELRTPLAALKVNFHNYLQSVSDQPLNPIMTDMRLSLMRMESAIEQILALYQLSAENFQRTFDRYELMPICQEAVLQLYQQVQEKQIEIQLLGQDIKLQVDARSLLLLLRNVIENSVKYTPDDGEIMISLGLNGNGDATIKVEDSGPGIAEEDHARVLRRFYRTDSAQKSESQIGSGLGLSIVKQVVALHQGSIKFSKSLQFGGLCVEISLPLSQPRLPVDSV